MHSGCLPTLGPPQGTPWARVHSRPSEGPHQIRLPAQVGPQIVRGQSCVPPEPIAGTEARLRQGRSISTHAQLKRHGTRNFSSRQAKKHVTLRI